MPTVPLHDITGSQTGQVELSGQVFGAAPNRKVLHQVLVAQLAAARQGTAHTKTRAEVSGSGRKLWRQKGTGRARVGDRRPPHWEGGGVAAGPRPRSYRQRLPRRVKTEALRSALSVRAKAGQLTVVEPFELPEPKTRALQQILGSLGAQARRVLLILGQHDDIIWRCGRNIPGLIIRPAADVNGYDVLAARHVILVQDAIAPLEARLS